MVLPTMPAYRVIAFGLSDIGLVRANNEDDWLQLPALHLYALADGMGGHKAGEIAAKTAIDSFAAIFSEHSLVMPSNSTSSQLCKLIYDVICEVNSEVYQLGCSDPALYGMGTTLCCLYFQKKYAIIGHVGDSRIYRLRDKKLIQMTQDHSLLLDLAGRRSLSQDKGQIRSKYRNVITKAIGTEVSVDPSVYASDLRIGDTFLLCSDGLSDLLNREQIEAILIQKIPLEEKTQQLIHAAKSKGGHDNITVVLVDVQKEEP